jgi:tRNA pseudouridine synthase 10
VIRLGDPNELFDKILTTARGYEFRSFVLGFERPSGYSRDDHEDTFRRLKIEVGTRLLEVWPERDVDFERPEVRFDVRSTKDGAQITVRSAPLFIGGRYLKYSRQIPACRWMHMACKGRGCQKCNYTGNVHGPSIQELAEPAVLKATGGVSTFFHGAGREDVDARMLGSGRPFVIEVRRPKRRALDLTALALEINSSAKDLTELRNLSTASREEMVLAKSAGAEKTYRARIRFKDPVPDELPELLGKLKGCQIEQLSPTRVMRRRGRNKKRIKRIIDSAVVGRYGNQVVWEVRTSAGTYIKELISGDGGRTQPSVASVTGTECHCEALDVLAVHWEPPWEKRI